MDKVVIQVKVNAVKTVVHIITCSLRDAIHSKLEMSCVDYEELIT